MELMNQLISRLRKDESGQGMVEYGLIVGLIAIIVIAVFVALGPQITNMFTEATGSETLDEAQYEVSQAVNN